MALRQVSEWFVQQHPGSHAVYLTFNDRMNQHVDETDGIDRRLAHRLLFAALNPESDVTFVEFVQELKPLRINLLRAVAAVRELFSMTPDAHLLIAADDLRQLGQEPEVGEASRACMEAMTILGNTVDVSVESRIQACEVQSLTPAATMDRSVDAQVEAHQHGLPLPGATIVCASTSAAIDVQQGIGDRPVYWMPLPPLNRPAEQPASASRPVVDQLDESHPAAGNVVNFIACLERKVNNERLPSVEDGIVALIRNLFFGVIVPMTTIFHYNLFAAVWAESAGLCTILRTSTYYDEVYMHPAAVRLLLEHSVVVPMVPKHPLLVGCMALTASLLQLAVPHHQLGCGRLLKRSVQQLMACMVLADWSRNMRDMFDGCCVQCPKLYISYDVTAVQEVEDRDGGIKLSSLPAGPWTSLVSLKGPSAADVLVSVPLKNPVDGKPRVLLMLQVAAADQQEAAVLRAHALHSKPRLDWDDRVACLAQDHTFVHCVCSIDPFMDAARVPLENLLQPSRATGGYVVYEAAMGLDHIATWCPMFSSLVSAVAGAQVCSKA